MLLSRVLVLCLMTSWSTAQQAPDIRLPRGVIQPTLYEVSIEPHMYGSEPTFTGNMNFTFHCMIATDRIVLHVKELNVSNIRLALAKRRPRIPVPSYVSHTEDTDRQFLNITLNRQMTAMRHYVLSMTFNAPLKRQPLAGFYLIYYSGPSGQKYMASTQFHPTYARRVFPCMDEPALKARFIITIIRRTSDTAISNMPINTSVSLGGDRVADVFEKTEVMSTYLVAFAVGDLDHRNATTRSGKTLEAWSRSEVVDQVENALNLAVQVFDYFESLFNYPYPMPKLSLLAVPEFGVGAMENWGLIIFNEIYFLMNPAVTSTNSKYWIYKTVAHEVAHMWFGNLVTPAWWDEMWLNEGFATFMSYVAVDFVYPEWNVMGEFATYEVQYILGRDGGFSSRPIYYPVRTPNEIQEQFNWITYTKSASVIHMLRNAIGKMKFRAGIADYLKTMSFQSADRDQLWTFLSEGRWDNVAVDVAAFMNTWIMQMNYPIVTVTKQGNLLTFSQQRFLDDRTATDLANDESPYGYRWVIPVTYTTSENTNFSNNNIQWLTGDRNLTVTDDSLRSNSWVVCNLNMNGYYRVNYDTDNWARLARQLKSDHTVIADVNRAQIMNDAWTLVKGSYLELPVALKLFEYLDNERDFNPWYTAAMELEFIYKMLVGTKITAAFKAFIRQTMRNIYNQMRMTASSEGLTFEQTRLKLLVAMQSCSTGVIRCKQDALALFAEWRNNPEDNTIDPELRVPIYYASMQFGTVEDWNFMFGRFINETNVQKQKDMRNSLSCTKNENLLRRLLQTALYSDKVKTQDRIRVINWVLKNDVGLPLAWNFVRENWDHIFDTHAEQLGVLSNLMTQFGTYFKDRTRLQEFQAFVNSTDDFGPASQAVVSAMENIQSNIRWLDQYCDPIKNWLQGQGFDV